MIEILHTNFYDGFAKRTAGIVIDLQIENQLFELLKKCIIEPEILKKELVADSNLSGKIKKIDSAFIEKIEFRAAFVFETIYFSKHNNLIIRFIPQLLNLLPLVKNSSTKRHFAKIVFKELQNINLHRSIENNIVKIDNITLDKISETMMEWAMDKKSKPAVKIWAIFALFEVRKEIIYRTERLKKDLKQNNLLFFSEMNKKRELIGAFLRDFIDYESINPLPSIQVSLRRWIKMLP